MRIIAGAFRGRRLHAPKGKRIRPTIDRVREAIFNIIAAEVAGAKVLDLFAGTGAMGLEALSRGAQFSFFVDQGEEAVRLIRENVQLCGVQDMSRIIQGSAASAIRRLGSENELFDLIFMDPPYGKGHIEKALEIIGEVARNDALVIAEHHAKDEPPQVSGIWRKDRERRYGDTLISVYSRL
ncbi:MAG: 16S rRNA (guanine(966)-N(2))-methyltransferase RsmD [Syntrophobacteraceae bacterium]|jgi:16S rRNA (guanine(966)-N(2))-methyltransferase RsmD